MTDFVNAILVIVLALNLFALGSSRILAVIRTVAMQGALLGLLPLMMHGHVGMTQVAAAVAAIGLKGIVIPRVMIRALRDAQIKREVEPLIGLLPSIVLGAAGTVFALLFSNQLPQVDEHARTLLVPTSIATLLTGFILLITRFKALTQVVGYLCLENGIFIFGLLLVDAMPLVIELGVLLDLFVGIFVTCIIVNHINRAFSSMDTRRLVYLRE